MVAAVQFERCVTGACILGVVICELGHWKEPCPIIQFEVDKGLKVGLYGAVLPFRLTVCLGVDVSGEPPLDAEKIAQR